MEEEWLENSMQSFLTRGRKGEEGRESYQRGRKGEWEELLNREEREG